MHSQRWVCNCAIIIGALISPASHRDAAGTQDLTHQDEPPEAAEAAAPVASGLTVENLNFNYRISGDDPAWRPLRAFDDGRQTFIEFPANIAVQAPPLFVVGPDEDAQLVNYRMAGRYYVVDRLFDHAEFRLGGRRQQIIRLAVITMTAAADMGGRRRDRRSAGASQGRP